MWQMVFSPTARVSPGFHQGFTRFHEVLRGLRGGASTKTSTACCWGYHLRLFCFLGLDPVKMVILLLVSFKKRYSQKKTPRNFLAEIRTPAKKLCLPSKWKQRGPTKQKGGLILGKKYHSECALLLPSRKERNCSLSELWVSDASHWATPLAQGPKRSAEVPFTCTVWIAESQRAEFLGGATLKRTIACGLLSSHDLWAEADSLAHLRARQHWKPGPMPFAAPPRQALLVIPMSQKTSVAGSHD